MTPIEELDLWFRHAETIGQNRLNNFLMTGTVLLVSCAALLNLTDHLLAGVLTVAVVTLGLILSVLWVFLGYRQRKFHEYLQYLADKVLASYSIEEREKNAFYRIRQLQGGLPLPDGAEKYQLTKTEQRVASRVVLILVPYFFAGAYLVFMVGGTWMFCHT